MEHKVDILNYTINLEIPELKKPSKKNFVFATINPHSYSIAKRDLNFRRALLEADVLLPDGIGIVMACRILNLKKIKRITGSDLHLELLKYLNDTNGTVFYLGSSKFTLELISCKLKTEFPNVKIDSYSPPFSENFTISEENEILRRIRSSNPNVLFVGMTAPKQEKWVSRNKDNFNVDYIASIGAVFDFYSDTVNRPGEFWQKTGLEWFPRLIKEPRRLWRRSLISLPEFMCDVIRAKMLNQK